jgi:capsule polysaccharide export protein KpsE/RkpR
MWMKKVCIMGEMRKDREKGLPNDVDGLIDHYRQEVRKGQEAYDELLKEVNMLRGTKQIVERLSSEVRRMKKRAEEAETETILVKGIGINSPEMKGLKSEVEALKQQLHVDSEKYKRENNDLYNRIADALEVNESHQKFNGKLQERLTEVEQENIELHAENKKMHNHLEERVDRARKSGM